MQTIKIINISLEVFGSIFCAALIICMIASEYRKTPLNKRFLRILACNTVLLISDAVAWGFKGSLAVHSLVLVRVGNFLVFALGYLLLALFTDYLNAYIATKTPIPRTSVYLVWGLCAVAVLLVVVSQFNGMYYFIDADNLYQRGPLYRLSQVWGIANMLINVVVVLRYRKAMRKKEVMLFLSYTLLPALAMAIQIRMYGLALLYIATTLSIFIIYVTLQSEQARLLKQRELELSEARVEIMLSQIRPHFLYNALAAIGDLCEQDPPAAQQAVQEFSVYLRGNLESLNKKGPIPFAGERRHVENYLALEQKRFGQRLRVVWQIEAEDFMLPALTLQPLVENAVRNGVTKRDEGGTITVGTEEAPDHWVVTVVDDGVGFDTTKPHPDERAHVGLANVRSRLAAICGGRLVVESTPGHGTTARVFIPKGGAQ